VKEEEGGQWGQVGQKGQIGWLVDAPIGLEVEKKSFWNKNWIFEFTKALEICTWRFRMNFGTRIFPKFF
jgi:hypothetical protein